MNRNRTGIFMRPVSWVGAIALAGLVALPVRGFAAEREPAAAMPGMGHAGHGAPVQSEMPGMRQPAGPVDTMHGADARSPSRPDAQTGATAPPTPAVPQGGAAPADARDPNAYSGGNTLETGAYALGGRRLLRLGDEQSFASLRVDRMEAVHTATSNAGAYDATAWFGRDYDRLVIKAEGEIAAGRLLDARTEFLWGHAIASFWDAELGLRHDSGVGPGRTWLAFGVQGLAPYWFELHATGYVGDGGRTALRVGGEYEALITQRLIVQPALEASLYGRSDPARDIGKGLSELKAGIRLRYEVTRQFAPYVGVEWSARFGETASLAEAAGGSARVTRYVAGLRFWF